MARRGAASTSADGTPSTTTDDTSTTTTDGTAVLTSIRAAEENQWNNLVTQAERGSLFHRYEWLAAVEDGLDSEPRHAIVRNDGNPVAVLPIFTSAIQLPHDAADTAASALDVSVLTSGEPGYGGPVVASDERENLDRLLDAVDATSDPRTLYHRISTHDLGHIRYGQLLAARGYEPTMDLATFVIDLADDWDTILDNMDKERRRDVRNAHDQPYRVDVDPLGDDLERTHEMYAANIDRVGGNLLPQSFFEALSDHVADRVRVFTAVVDGDTVGKYVYLLDTERSVLHHWLSAIPDRDCYDAHPSELMHARAIQWGIERGFDQYSFDTAGSCFDNSVFRFKAKYGGRAVPVLRWERGTNRLAWPLFKFARSKYRERALAPS